MGPSIEKRSWLTQGASPTMLRSAGRRPPIGNVQCARKVITAELLSKKGMDNLWRENSPTTTPPRYRCRNRHQDCRCCEGAGVAGCFQAGLCNRWRGEYAKQITYSKFGRWNLHCVFFLIPFTGALRRTQLRPVWCPSQTQLHCQTGKQTATTSQAWRSRRPRFRPGWYSPARRLPTSRRRSKEPATSGICGCRAARTSLKSEDMVHRRNIQTRPPAIYSTVDSECVREVRWCCQTSAPCLCIDVVSQKEGLQEGELFNIYLYRSQKTTKKLISLNFTRLLRY